MTNKCYGNGQCIKKRNNNCSGTKDYYKPYKCSYGCKLVMCNYCKKSMHPLWVLEKGAGRCSECLRIRYNEMQMHKLFC